MQEPGGTTGGGTGARERYGHRGERAQSDEGPSPTHVRLQPQTQRKRESARRIEEKRAQLTSHQYSRLVQNLGARLLQKDLERNSVLEELEQTKVEVRTLKEEVDRTTLKMNYLDEELELEKRNVSGLEKQCDVYEETIDSMDDQATANCDEIVRLKGLIVTLEQENAGLKKSCSQRDAVPVMPQPFVSPEYTPLTWDPEAQLPNQAASPFANAEMVRNGLPYTSWVCHDVRCCEH